MILKFDGVSMERFIALLQFLASEDNLPHKAALPNEIVFHDEPARFPVPGWQSVNVPRECVEVYAPNVRGGDQKPVNPVVELLSVGSELVAHGEDFPISYRFKVALRVAGHWTVVLAPNAALVEEFKRYAEAFTAPKGYHDASEEVIKEKIKERIDSWCNPDNIFWGTWKQEISVPASYLERIHAILGT